MSKKVSKLTKNIQQTVVFDSYYEIGLLMVRANAKQCSKKGRNKGVGRKI
jgi:hypothetical protein